MPVELSPVDFVRLVDLGERRVIKKGELLSEAGVTQEEVFLIVEGTAEVSCLFDALIRDSCGNAYSGDLNYDTHILRIATTLC